MIEQEKLQKIENCIELIDAMLFGLSHEDAHEIAHKILLHVEHIRSFNAQALTNKKLFRHK